MATTSEEAPVINRWLRAPRARTVCPVLFLAAFARFATPPPSLQSPRPREAVTWPKKHRKYWAPKALKKGFLQVMLEFGGGGGVVAGSLDDTGKAHAKSEETTFFDFVEGIQMLHFATTHHNFHAGQQGCTGVHTW